MKLHIYITDPVGFARGDFETCWYAKASESHVTDWIHAGTVDLELDIDLDTVTQSAVAGIEAKINEIRAKSEAAINALEGDKAKLLSIEHKPC